MFTVTFLQDWKPTVDKEGGKIKCTDYEKGVVINLESPSAGLVPKKRIGQRLYVGMKQDVYELEKSGIVSITNN